MQVVIIGGSDAGISAALRIKELDNTVKVMVIVADSFPNYSICGLPFYLSGEVNDWHQLAHRTAAEITAQGIELWLNSQAENIDLEHQTVTVYRKEERTRQLLKYDRLLIATGAVSRRPANLLSGLELPGVFLLRWMNDSFEIEKYLEERQPRKVTIIGGGYIGLEMADALTLRGLEVTLLEHGASVLKTVDSVLGNLVKVELERHNVQVVTGVTVQNIEAISAAASANSVTHPLKVNGIASSTHKSIEVVADMVLVAVGATPNTQLAQAAGIAIGSTGAIKVSRTMQTNFTDIYAAGDCVETWHRLLAYPTYLPLGTTAHKQGRIAGENIAGGYREFAGTLETQVVKVFDLAVARTGLRDEEVSHQAGNHPYTLEVTAYDHKVYYPQAHSLHLLITGDTTSGSLLGAQIAGHYHGEVAKRIDIFATALHNNLTVEELSDLDLSYTPPLGSPWDAVQQAAQVWTKSIKINPNIY